MAIQLIGTIKAVKTGFRDVKDPVSGEVERQKVVNFQVDLELTRSVRELLFYVGDEVALEVRPHQGVLPGVTDGDEDAEDDDLVTVKRSTGELVGAGRQRGN